MARPPIVKTTLSGLFKQKTLTEKRIPLAFDYEITARCNNNCDHCYINVPASYRAAKQKELSLSEIERITNEAVSLGTLWCLLSGGEPLLREDFEDIYLLMKKKGLLLSVFTNATLIDQRHIRLFKHYPPRTIEVTVYGITRETYGRVTGCPANFSTFQRGLNLLLKNNIPVRLKTMALKSNIHELPGIAAFCRKHTKDYFRFDPLLHLRSDCNTVRNRQIISERLSPEEIAGLEHADKERSEALKKNCHIYINKSVDKSSCGNLFKCGAGLDSFSLSYDGFFRLCASLTAPSCIYNLKKGSLHDAWSFVSKVRSMHTSDSEVKQKCGQCDIFNLCLWCPAHSYLESGQLDRWSAYFCEVAHARARALEEKMGTK